MEEVEARIFCDSFNQMVVAICTYNNAGLLARNLAANERQQALRSSPDSRYALQLRSKVNREIVFCYRKAIVLGGVAWSQGKRSVLDSQALGYACFWYPPGLLRYGLIWLGLLGFRTSIPFTHILGSTAAKFLSYP